MRWSPTYSSLRRAGAMGAVLTVVAAGIWWNASGSAAAGIAGNVLAAAAPTPINPRATPQTVALYQNLKALEGRATLFGHQDALAYGHNWSAVDGRSDVKDVVGAHPSVLGFDVGRLETGSRTNIDGVDFDNMKRWIRQGYEIRVIA